jgi:hypothetical protein
MKKCLLIIALLVGFQGFSKEIPGPSVLFSISEKILTQAQQLIFPSFEKPVQKPMKVKPIIKVKSKAPLKVVDSAPQEKPAVQASTVKVKRDGMFITTE